MNFRVASDVLTCRLRLLWIILLLVPDIIIWYKLLIEGLSSGMMFLKIAQDAWEVKENAGAIVMILINMYFHVIIVQMDLMPCTVLLPKVTCTIMLLLSRWISWPALFSFQKYAFYPPLFFYTLLGYLRPTIHFSFLPFKVFQMCGLILHITHHLYRFFFL